MNTNNINDGVESEFGRKLRAVVLAAGQAKRFGSPKQLAKIGEETLLEKAINLALAADRVPLVTLGAHKAEINSQIGEALSVCEIISVSNWETGMSASFHAIKDYLSPNKQVSHLLVMLCDQPGLSTDDISRLCKLSEHFPDSVVCCDYSTALSNIEDSEGNKTEPSRKIGPPVIFPSEFVKKFSDLQGDCGAKSLMRGGDIRVLQLNSCLADIDTLEALMDFKAMSVAKS